MLILTQELPFEGVGPFLRSRGIDVKELKNALHEYNDYCAEMTAEKDHYEDPVGWLEAVGYRQTVEDFLGLI
ncbi:hypothetical protein [Arundinibacter roseus]|uniref:Uncharacterized protein n=1 Tax=Arundinibacter roseus TaxID=2070510 RepID=A0A4R4KJ38_9BACT|nr:hypothetical protein [Arundinibacter roseus]TDB66826.1 hypothetical protein EZE20_06790 [Arundinibacter roseus]